MQTQCVIFDMAGTTVDEDNLVYKTLQKALNQNGVDVDLNFVLLHGAGKEKFQAIKDIIDRSSFEVKETLQLNIFNQFLKALDLAYATFQVVAMPNAEFVFSKLRTLGISVVLNTGYNRQTAESLLMKLNWKVGDQIDLLVTASDVAHNRPMPDMIYYAQEQLNITDTKYMVKVGDSCVDIEEGKNANCLFSIGITTGAQTETQLKLAQPDFIIHNLSNLLEIISE